MTWVFLALLFLQTPPQAPAVEDREAKVRRLIEEISESGRVLQIAEDSSERADPTPRIAPGDPPLLAFRYFEGQEKHRFGQLDLVMDDAGH
jgi:hypothetical protein